MIPSILRVSLLVGIMFYFFLLLVFLKNKSIALKYTLLWMLAGVVMLIFILFPELLFWITGLFGIQSGMNGLFIVCIGFVVMILMAITSIVSNQKNRIKCLTQEMAILEKKIRELEKEK